MDPVRGLEGIWEALAPIHDICSEIDWVVHHIAEGPEGNVYTERNDRFAINGNWVEIPVMGIFEFSNGKITGWRDYFDLKQVTDQMTEAMSWVRVGWGRLKWRLLKYLAALDSLYKT